MVIIVGLILILDYGFYRKIFKCTMQEFLKHVSDLVESFMPDFHTGKSGFDEWLVRAYSFFQKGCTTA